MGLFKKKREKDENLALLRKLDQRGVSILAERDPATYQERILGRDGAFSITEEDELVISCENKILFRYSLKEIRGGELMNLSGICLNVGERRFVAYYTDGTLGKKK
ncbi:MAG: hypothetical protein IJN80_02270 [Clostridia bacterium]|nr:hypothetical protein [Clostridia bacterium]